MSEAYVRLSLKLKLCDAPRGVPSVRSAEYCINRDHGSNFLDGLIYEAAKCITSFYAAVSGVVDESPEEINRQIEAAAGLIKRNIHVEAEEGGAE